MKIFVYVFETLSVVYMSKFIVAEIACWHGC